MSRSLPALSAQTYVSVVGLALASLPFFGSIAAATTGVQTAAPRVTTLTPLQRTQLFVIAHVGAAKYVMGLPVVAGAALAGALAYRPLSALHRRLALGVVSANVAAVVFSQLLVMPVNTRLLNISLAEDEGAAATDGVRLRKRWDSLNAYRAVILGAAWAASVAQLLV